MTASIKLVLAIIFSAACVLVHAQAVTRVLAAGSAKAKIIEGNDETAGWRINPNIRLDVHELSKSIGAKRVRFYTDKDSLDIQLSPGQSYDFVVLLNGHDSCHTRMINPVFHDYANDPERHDTLAFQLTPYSNIAFRACINGRDSIWLAFDSGSTGLLLTDSCIRSLSTPVNLDSATNSLSLGTMNWKTIPVYNVSRTPHGMGGVFGWDFFDGRVVEINYDKSLFIVHTKLPRTGRGYSAFPIEYNHGLVCIYAVLNIRGRSNASRCLYDNGYERTVMLDTALLLKQGLPRDLPVLKRTILHNDHNKEIPVLTVLLDALDFGHQILHDVPAQLLATGNPARFETHILGAEVLKRFNTILDFQHNKVYLKPSRFFNMPYTETATGKG